MVKLPEGYCIDRTEVTRGQYAAWLSTNPSTAGQISDCTWNTSFATDASCMRLSDVYQGSGSENHPQLCVDWCDAYAYCQGVGKRLCGKIGGGSNGYSDYANAALDQWHNACVSDGADNTYPYGNTYQPDYCNGVDHRGGTTVPVGSMTTCQSSVPGYEGVYDLSGNVMEWEDSCDGVGQSALCRVRDASFGFGVRGYLRCDFGDYANRNFLRNDLGFRCCS